MAAKITKLIVTNGGALRRKYGPSGWADIQAAVSRLAMADSIRGINTSFALVDAPGAGVPKVSSARSAKQCKATIDALVKKHSNPDYIMILGGRDVIPYQSLGNPLRGTPDDDGDKSVPSDLPYACDAPYSRNIQDFIGPTRVVGRLPDIWGGKQKSDLPKLLDTAAVFTKSPAGKPFVLSADEWKGATIANVKRAFGAAHSPVLCPPKGPPWSAAQLAYPVHFINCHGAAGYPDYFGDLIGTVAHQPLPLKGAVASGSLVVAECCYGAEIYRPGSIDSTSIADTYLLEGAIAFIGSTNTAYGNGTAKTRCYADILCSEALRGIMNKATTGRALLQARLDYVQAVEAMDPVHLKTLAQFVLLGDPSLRPAGAAPSPAAGVAVSKSILTAATAGMVGLAAPRSMGSMEGHAKRRKQLRAKGRQLAKSKPAAVPARLPAAVKSVVMAEAANHGLWPGRVLKFSVERPSPNQEAVVGTRKALAKRAVSTKQPTENIYVVFAKTQGAPDGVQAKRASHLGVTLTKDRSEPGKPSRLRSVRLAIIRTSAGKVVSYREAVSKS